MCESIAYITGERPCCSSRDSVKTAMRPMPRIIGIPTHGTMRGATAVGRREAELRRLSNCSGSPAPGSSDDGIKVKHLKRAIQ